MSYVYKPVVSASSGPYSGKALVGTHSAVIGWTFENADLRHDLKGFAIKRSDIDPVTKEVLRTDWLQGYKRFKETDNGKLDSISSLEGPFQRFRWNDYTLKQDRAYKYEVFPMRGQPGNLTRKEKPLVFDLLPSQEDQDDLGVFVNRGVTAAMAYLQRFKNRQPSEVGDAAYTWLSRGLKESLLQFIALTKAGEELHVAIYEFFDHEIAKAFRDAITRGVKVSIVHDARPGKDSTEQNEEVIRLFNLIPPVSIPRTTVNISHNKFVIRLAGDISGSVWTGSANFSGNAFNFQSNTALVVRDKSTAEYYEEYFQGLSKNPPKAESKLINKDIMSRANVGQGKFAERTFFSPVSRKHILECAVDLINSAESAILISAPFGLDNSMIAALHANPHKILEYGLVNTSAKKKIETLQRDNTRYFTPTRLRTYMGRSWDAKAFGAHKIHAKTIVVDPYGESPRVLIGSANFSRPSCSDNDENALLITGNRRLAAIIATEFMRMYDHYKTRYYIDLTDKENKKIKNENKIRKKNGQPLKHYLSTDNFLVSNDSWSKTAFDPESPSHKYMDRIVFSGG
jgi:phosphatidylserine/phosphatidylglycerophosphate/cardiolipin synthase-like enzyme